MKKALFYFIVVFLILFGVSLILDNFIFHYVKFDYERAGVKFIDPFIDHWMWGAVFIAIGVWLYRNF